MKTSENKTDYDWLLWVLFALCILIYCNTIGNERNNDAADIQLKVIEKKIDKLNERLDSLDQEMIYLNQYLYD